MACKSLCYPCPYDHWFVPKMIGVHCNKILSQGQLFTHNEYNLTYIAFLQKELSFGQLFLYITPHFLSWCGTRFVHPRLLLFFQGVSLHRLALLG